MPKLIAVDEEIYTHEILWRSSSNLLLQAEADEEKAHYFLMPALLISFLAFEAFVNFCGHVLLPNLWKEEKKNFQGKGLEGKLGAVLKRLPAFRWAKDSPPYQTIKNLEAFRHMVAHGKVVASAYVAEQKDDGRHFRFEHAWDEYLSLEAVISARNEIKAFSESVLLEARKASDHPHLVFPAYEGPLASGSGISNSANQSLQADGPVGPRPELER
jgi:hypothetical protein